MTVYGWDASHFDAVPDGARVEAEGFGFMTHKAGGDARDPELPAWWSAMRPHRDSVLLGAYWVLKRTDGLLAADAFLADLDNRCPGWRDGPFILQLDCESWQGGAVPAPTKGQIQACANRLHSRMPKLVPIVYAPKWVYGDTLTGLGYPLWASSYVSGSGPASKLYPGDSSSHWGAYSGQTPAILQFSSSATIAGQTTCDANAYRGTLAELTALLAPGWSDDMADLTAADKSYLDAKFASITAFDANQPDGTPTSKIGRAALEQGIPNGTKDQDATGGYPRDQAWQVIEDLGVQLVSVREQLATLTGAALTIPQAQLDLAVLNALKTLAGGQV